MVSATAPTVSSLISGLLPWLNHPTEKENSHKPAAHSGSEGAPPASSAGGATPQSGSVPPDPPDHPHDKRTAASGLAFPALFSVDSSKLYVAKGYLGLTQRAHPRSIAIMRVGPPMVRVAVIELDNPPIIAVQFAPNGDRLMAGEATYSLMGPTRFFFSQYPV
jgi:hypothetical protein